MQGAENDLSGSAFAESENQKMIADMVRDFGKKKSCRRWWSGWIAGISGSGFKKLGGLGLMVVLVPEEYGGQALGYLSNTLRPLRSLSSKICGSILFDGRA